MKVLHRKSLHKKGQPSQCLKNQKPRTGIHPRVASNHRIVRLGTAMTVSRRLIREANSRVKRLILARGWAANLADDGARNTTISRLHSGLGPGCDLFRNTVCREVRCAEPRDRMQPLLKLLFVGRCGVQRRPLQELRIRRYGAQSLRSGYGLFGVTIGCNLFGCAI